MKEIDLNTWEVPLNLAYITYEAKDAYACYDMYRRILDMRACLLPVTDEYMDSRQEGLDVVLYLFIAPLSSECFMH